MAQRQRAWLITTRSQDQNLLPVFIIRSFQNCHAVTTAQQHFTDVAQRYARVAHNHEVTGSKPVVGIYLHIAMVHQGTGANPPNNRGGAEGARGAHNSEVVGSNPTSGIVKLDVKRSACLPV